jgi:hypothetical protein
MIYIIIPTFSEGVEMVGDSECNLDHPPINNHGAYVILSGMVLYIVRGAGKFVAPGDAK